MEREVGRHREERIRERKDRKRRRERDGGK